jgi:hypothetical protein
MAKAKVLNGKDFMVFVNTKATALATSHRLSLNAETSDSASKDDGFWDEAIVTKMSWEASTEALVAAEEGAESYDVLYDLMMANEPVDLVMGVPTNITNDGVPEAGWTAPTKGYTGKALITSLERTDSNGSNSTMTATFRGVGKLSKLDEND